MNIAIDSLEKSRDYLKKHNFGRAFAHFLVVLQLIEDDDRQSFYEEFKFTWLFWQNTLLERKDFQNLVNCFQMAHNFFPKIGIQELNEIGIQLLRSNYLIEAQNIFEVIQTRAPSFLPVEHNLWSTKNALVERWHFRMLNDFVRNQSYLNAIRIELSRKKHKNVLDIGTGSGILSIFASQNLKNSANIIGCDGSQIMIQIAKNVAKNNGKDEIIFQNVLSTMLATNQRFSLVITEILDTGVFGEGILQTLVHAWKNLLDPNGRVIPSHVIIYIAAISSAKITSKFHLNPKISTLNLNRLCLSYNSEPYDTENLQKTHHNLVSNVQKCLEVNFNNPDQLEMLLNSHENNPEITLSCLFDGQIDCFAFWFKLYLNETIFVTNDPREPQNSCWEQALISLTHPLNVAHNDTLTLKISCVNGVLKICKLAHNKAPTHLESHNFDQNSPKETKNNCGPQKEEFLGSPASKKTKFSLQKESKNIFGPQKQKFLNSTASKRTKFVPVESKNDLRYTKLDRIYPDGSKKTLNSEEVDLLESPECKRSKTDPNKHCLDSKNEKELPKLDHNCTTEPPDLLEASQFKKISPNRSVPPKNELGAPNLDQKFTKEPPNLSEDPKSDKIGPYRSVSPKKQPGPLKLDPNVTTEPPDLSKAPQSDKSPNQNVSPKNQLGPLKLVHNFTTEPPDLLDTSKSEQISPKRSIPLKNQPGTAKLEPKFTSEPPKHLEGPQCKKINQNRSLPPKNNQKNVESDLGFPSEDLDLSDRRIFKKLGQNRTFETPNHLEGPQSKKISQNRRFPPKNNQENVELDLDFPLENPELLGSRNLKELGLNRKDEGLECFKMDLNEPDLEKEGPILALEIHECFNLERSEITLLNDGLILEAFERLSEKLSGHDKVVLDLTSIPVFGLLCFEKGAKLFCNVRDSIRPLVKSVCDLNNLDFDKIVFLSEDNFTECKFEVIFQLNLIENSGRVNENEVKTSLNWKSYLEHNGLYLPQNISIWSQLIYSDWLENVTKVNDKNCCGLKISEVINSFKTKMDIIFVFYYATLVWK